MDTPPLLSPPSALRCAAYARVAIALALFGLIDFAAAVTAIVTIFQAPGPVSFHLTPSFLVLWVAAWLVWRGNPIAWLIIRYLSPVGVGVMAGGALATILCLPWKLTVALASHAIWTDFSVLYFVSYAALFAWLTWETSRPSLSTAAPNKWFRAPALFLYGALPGLFLVMGVVALLQGDWTRHPIELARQQKGDAYSYWVQNWRQQTANGETHGYAVVLAYNDQELEIVTVRW